jgi:hypothetical protein
VVAADDVHQDIEPLAVAKILKAIVDEEKPELVLAGKQAIDNDMNATGQMLSALLGWSPQDYKPWLNYLLETKLAFPKWKEVARIRHKHHLDDFYGSKQAKASHLKVQYHIWNASLWVLRFIPFIRLRYFLRHIKERLNEQVASR